VVERWNLSRERFKKFGRTDRWRQCSDPNSVVIAECSFCGKAASEVIVLIAGGGCHICDECVELCAKIVREKKGKSGTALGRDVFRDGEATPETPLR
jgi:hypothetical protein